MSERIIASCVSVDSIPALECQICMDTWRQPIQLYPCGHIYCASCVTSTSDCCPGCKCPIQDRRQPPEDIVKRALAVPVKCGSCGWRGTRKASECHRCGVADTQSDMAVYPDRCDEEIVRQIEEAMRGGGGGGGGRSGAPPVVMQGVCLQSADPSSR